MISLEQHLVKTHARLWTKYWFGS